MGVKYAVPVMIAAFLIMGANSDAATKNKQPKASLVKEADVSRTLSFNDEGHATVDVLMAAKSGKDEIQMAFLPNEGSIIDVQRGDPEAPKGMAPSLAWTASPIAGSPAFKRIQIQVHKARGVSPKVAAGRLVINPGNGAKPLTVELTSKPGPENTAPIVQPASVTIVVTRPLGPLTPSSDDIAKPQEDNTSTKLLGTSVRTSGLLTNSVKLSSGSSSKQVNVAITAKPDAAQNSTVTLKVTKAEVKPGEYSGKIPLIKGKDSPVSVETKVLVKDSLIWPIIFALFGSLAGWLLVVGYERWRRASLLRNAALDLRTTINDAKNKLPGEWFESSELKKALEDATQQLCGIHNSLKNKFPFNATYEKALEKFEPLETKVRPLLSLTNSVNRLWETTKKLKKDTPEEHRDLISADTDYLLGATAQVCLDDVKASETFQAEVERQVKIIVVFMRLVVAYSKAADPDNNPTALYDHYGLLAYRDEAETKKAILEFNSRIIRWAGPTREVAVAASPNAYGSPLGAESDMGDPAGDALLKAPSLDRTPDPAKIVETIRKWDLLTGLAIAFIAILAGVLAFDSIATFGSWQQYLLLLTTAALAQGIPANFKVNWDQLGPGRSLKHSKTETKA